MRRVTLHALAGSAVLTATTVAVAASVSSAAPSPAPEVASGAVPPAAVVAEVESRERAVAASRSSARTAAAATAVRKKRSTALARERGYSADTSDPRKIARQIMDNRYGWGDGQFDCYDSLIKSESMWRVAATNPSSGTYGIPQALPGRKMASAGSDWETNPATQIRWGLDYVKDRYGTPCSAWSFKQANNWY